MSTSLPTIKINKKILRELGYVLEGTLCIPDTIDYKDKKYLITKIDKNGFRGCRKITRVSIPAAVTDIEPHAFARCSKLESVEYRGDANNQLTRIHDNAFDWTHLNEISLPPNVLSLGRFAFSYNTHVTTISLPNSLKTIERFAFTNCPNVEHVVIPDSVESLAYHAFDGCEGLQSVQMGHNIEDLEEGVFADCWELTEFIIPEGVKRVHLRAFDGCANIKHVKIPSTVQEIYEGGWLWQSCMQYFTYNGSRDDWKDMWANYNHDRIPLSQPVKCLDGAVRSR